MIKLNVLLIAALSLIFISTETYTQTNDVWSHEKVNTWYANHIWPVGCNFIPSSAINQLEMWQAETFDTATISKELGWAANIGFNTVRVFLHHVAWQIDPSGFTERVKIYLTIANSHGIKTIFVLFDDCWNATYKAGKQPDPKPGIHNSGWLRDPGDLLFTDTTLYITLEKYEKFVLKEFSPDNRILAWDLYNEPGNSDYGLKSLPFLKKVFVWAREVNPSQPITSGLWSNIEEINKFQLDHSDIISYHNYQNDTLHKEYLKKLKLYNRPLICTEYMARKYFSRIDNILPMLKSEKVGALNWGLVCGKTNTIYAWNDSITDGCEPKLWFHDIFRKNGTPYKPEEVDLIKKLTNKN